MATAPVVVPGAQTLLAQSVVLDATLTTSQTVFTVPAGMRAVVTGVVFRDASAAVNAATTWSAGFDASSVNVFPTGRTTIQSMAATTAQYSFNAVGAIASTTSPLQGQATTNFSVKFGGTLTSNGTVKCDVLGYLEAY